ncbi:MAG: circularly permuted type 2 ATP-grasp protein [Gammaproteobacteria bacterium]|nr:circularly permuted type 2 ATP-grasp protein [Rhodocyclaceae bacterium]MBU3909205.1 circularly permuted type 2 ATP-grasp protein [Gammaproteobacteria bacterium]MBU3990145.1 circularly permuted type 2 ATP-grasp protein [Gammaproteobacteria bacterium]MBU4005635.1 circularly permuted type 2 ATP-grasp protein [Gammaproteobacteria bacterium]MBU4020812.1 circularly permuted type 2 ATP-grasp protein [Gammaproteobacteria bacterium]
MPIKLHGYPQPEAYDELLDAKQQPRPAARVLFDYVNRLGTAELMARRASVDAAIMAMGITFTVYSDAGNIDRVWPFDIIPRTMSLKEWAHIDAGLKQRLTALNLFIDDLYNAQRIVKDGVFPLEVLEGSKNFRPQCSGLSPRFGVWAHVCGTDLVRDKDGTVFVLEDNLRVPSGVSYMLENRQLMKRLFPELFKSSDILPVDDYPTRLFDTLAALSPRPGDRPVVVVLTPGIYNSAYFEHSYLAQKMGATLVEGSDLVVKSDDCVYMKTIAGFSRVDVIYRRVDDDFLDPEAFRPDSALGVPGLMRAWRAGNVGIANAPGAGVADDKVVYTFVPQMIKYYLDQDPILPNVPSWMCMYEDQREHVLANLDKLVVKPANESGGYGMLIGPRASVEERRQFADLIRANPRNYMAQPTLSISTAPTLIGDQLAPRHIDLRPFVLQSEALHVTAGGLTRVALREGSLVVNSSQGGGSKDTWIVNTREA